MVGDAGARADLRFVVRHDHAVVQVVGVGVDVGVVGDGAAGVDDDLAAVVEQDVFVDGAVVFHRQVVAEGNLDAVEDFYVLAAMLEDVAREHVAHAKA